MFRLFQPRQPPHADLVLRGADAIADWRDLHPGETLDLRHADLRGAILATADLRGADLTNAVLDDANLSGAKLHGAVLKDVSLRDARLASAHGLLAGQLAGADLAGAELPPTINVERLNEAARCGDSADYARAIYMWTLGACAFVWLMLISTTQLQLLTNDGVVNLPVFDVEAPSEVFFLVGPFLLIGIYYYLHVYLQRIWDALAALPAVFPDGESIDRKTHGWMVLGLVRWERRRLKGRPPMFLAQTALSLLLVWGLVPITVYAVWHRCAIRHVWNQSMIQVIACSLAAYVAIGSLSAARSTFSPRWRWARFIAQHALAIGVLYGLHGLMQSTFEGKGQLKWFNAVVDHYHPTDRTPKWGRTKQQLQNEYLDESQFLGIDYNGQRDPDTPPASGRTLKEKLTDLNKRWREAYAEFSGPLLAKTNLQGAEVEYSDLSSSDLSSSNWMHASITSVDFTQSNIAYADFTRANINDMVVLGGAGREAKFTGARAWGFIALGADFSKAWFEGFEAVGPPADFRETILDNAHFAGAFLPSARLQGASLVGADFHDAVLIHADLTNANLSGADLTGADLRGAKLKAADLTGAKLTDVKFGFASLRYIKQFVSHQTEIDGAILTGASGPIAELVAAAAYKVEPKWDRAQEPVQMAALPEEKGWDAPAHGWPFAPFGIEQYPNEEWPAEAAATGNSEP